MESSQTENAPLILSPSAARRLKLLLGHGVEPTPHMQEQCVALDRAAALLPLKVSILEQDITGSDQDIRSECAVTMATLKTLKLSVGTLIKVSLPNTDAHQVTRLGLIPEGEHLTAYLSPVLSYNLGLAVHLWPLLHDIQPDASATVANCAHHNNKLPPSFETIILSRFEGEAPPKEGEELEASNLVAFTQPTASSTYIRIASSVAVAAVRSPASGALWSALAGDEKGMEDGDGPVPDGMKPQPYDPSVANLPNDFAPKDGTEEAVNAIQAYFKEKTRIVSVGDLIAAPKARDDPSAEFLDNMYTKDTTENAQNGVNGCAHGESVSNENDQPAEELMYFKVVRIYPTSSTPQAVVIGQTMMNLDGSCSSSLPVGVDGFLSRVKVPENLVGVHPTAAFSANMRQFHGVNCLLPVWRDIAQLLASLLHPAAAKAPLKVSILLHGPAGAGKGVALAAAAAAVGCHRVAFSCHDVRPMGLAERKVLETLKAVFASAAEFAPTLLVLEDFEVLAQEGPHSTASFAARTGSLLAECIQMGFKPHNVRMPGDPRVPGSPFPAPVILAACTSSLESVPASIRRCFTHTIGIDAPDQARRKEILSSSLASVDTMFSEDALEDLARHTAGLLPRDLQALAADACSLAGTDSLSANLVASYENNNGLSAADGTKPLVVDANHVEQALERARQRTAEDIGAPKIPNVAWEDVGGLEDVKRSILDTVELPLKHPELFSGGLRRRSGVLLYGPPGTGKTLLAKAVATECSVNFMSVKGPELISMYVGESERLIREVFAKARRARPCVIFFDELDSLAPARGKGSDSGGVMDRIVAQLLAEIDGVHSGGGTDDVFMIGATNRPDLLDPALMRPGRLDQLLYVGVASDPSSQLKVIRALTRKFIMHTNVDLEEVAARCPPRLTGADLYALCSDAWMVALKRTVGEGLHLEQSEEDALNDEECDIIVCQEDFEAALINLRPSLTEEDIAKYEQIKHEYESR